MTKILQPWLLADAIALQEVFGTEVKLYPKPEEIDDPKKEYSDIFGRYKKNQEDEEEIMIERNCREKLIASIDLEELANRCAKGFKPFTNEVRLNIKGLFENKI